MRKLVLNVGAWEERSIVNGPGERFVIWFQGCPLKCKGCFNENFISFEKRHVFGVNKLASMILSIKGIEGVTYTGGEPMVQSRPLYYLSKILKDNNLSILCYTGYTIEELKKMKNKWVKMLLGMIDILIDGRYEENLKANLMWRGSKNQKIYFLSDRYRHLQEMVNSESESQVEIIIKNEKFITTGIIDKKFIDLLKEKLKK